MRRKRLTPTVGSIGGLALILALVASLSFTVAPGAAAPPGPDLYEVELAPWVFDEGPAGPAAPGADTYVAVADTMVLQGYATNSFGDAPFFIAGYDECTSQTCPDWPLPMSKTARSLIRFNLGGLAPAEAISRATLRVYFAGWGGVQNRDTTITAHRIGGAWNEASVTWNSQPGSGEGYGAASIRADSNWRWVELDVTGLVRAWVNGTYPNHGVMLRGKEVAGTGEGWRLFGTRESSARPELVIERAANQPPTLSGLPDQALPMNSSRNNAIDLYDYASDPEDADAALTFTIRNSPAAGAGVSLDGGRYIDINPSAGWQGTTSVEIEVRDTGGLTDTDAFQVTVSASGTRLSYLPYASLAPIVASGRVRSSESGRIEHPSGARIEVPPGAVPDSISGGEGEMLFTIERGAPEDFGVPSEPPPGWRVVGQTFRMGPEGFTFNTPIETAIGLPDDFDRTEEEVAMFDYDRQEGEWETVGGQVEQRRDGRGREVRTDALHLCANTIMARNVSGKGYGAIRFTGVPGYSFKLCIESYTLKDAGWDSDFEAGNRYRAIIRGDSPNAPADGYQYWILPQGTYNLSIGVYRHTDDSAPPQYIGYFQRTITIDRPHWDWQMGGPDFEFAVPFGSMITGASQLTSGRPPCMGTPTPSVGVGEVNVRLDWNANADLDLWVLDPCGNKIYYGDYQATCQGSIGKLDLDNKCSDMVRGRPENIYWGQSPPRGTYKVYVDYYQNCGGAGAVNYTVQAWVGGQVYTWRGVINPPASAGASGDERLVAQFTR